MLSSERILYGASAGRGAHAGPRPVALPAESSPHEEGVVLRGARPRPGSPDRHAVANHEGHPAAGRAMFGQGAESARAADEQLHRLHKAAEARGYRAGVARAERELSEAVAGAGALAAQLEAAAPAERTAVARWVTDLSLAIARRILGDAISVDPARMVGAVERAISVAAGSPDVRVLLHPASVAPVRDAWEAAHGPGYLGKRWTFGPDPSVPPGGCLIRYQHGLVDAGLETQLDAIAEAVFAAIGGGDPMIVVEPVP